MSIEIPERTTTPTRLGLNLDKSTWTRVRFGEVVKNANSKVKDPAAEGVDRIIAMEHLDPGEITVQRWGTVEDGTTFTRYVKPWQTLFGKRRAYQRKAAFAEFEAVCSGDILTFEAIEGRILPEFLPFVVQSDGFYDHALGTSAGSLSPRTNWRDLKNYEFSLPPLDEQKRLADLLWSLERHRAAALWRRASANSAYRSVIDHAIDQLVRTESIPFAETWERSAESGWSASAVDEATGRFVLSLAALGADGYRRDQRKSIPESEKARKASLQYGDLLISRANTADKVGRIGIFDEDRSDVSFPDTMMRLRLRQVFDPQFVEAVISSDHGRQYMRRAAAGSATSMVKINRQSLGRFPFPNAEPEVQESIVRFKLDQKSATQALDDELCDLVALRSALLTEVFEGAE